MTKNEWDKCFTWIVESFQNWTPSEYTSSVWYEEFQGMSPEGFKIAARSAMKKTPSPFPPSVSQIMAELKPEEDTELLAQEAWSLALYNHPEKMDSVTYRVFQALGSPDKLRFMQNDEVKWIEKRFIKLWIGAKAAEGSQEVFEQIENQDFKKLTASIGMGIKKL